VTELSKAYEHLDVEKRWYPVWRDAGYFHAEDASDKPAYCIAIPPPNVTGSLHIGHGLTVTIEDVLIRWRRMQGYNALWMPGTDHAGIATQMVVTRELAKEGVSRHDLGREAFIAKVWEWKEVYHARITKQLEVLGVSLDWERERFTMDDGLSRAVRKVFVELYKDGLIYRDKRLVNWSPGIHTVLSDLEVEYEEKAGKLWHLAYPVAGSDERLVVATTRPETMLGDTAVAVHSEDPRYKHLIGKRVALPLTGREIPIIADDILVDPAFGTGAVKVTPAHDFNDFEVGKRHGLPMISIFDADAKLNDAAPEVYRGLERYAARKRIVADLDELGLLVEVKDHVLNLGHCQRSGVPVEPMLSDQWYVRVQPLAEPAIAAVRDGRTRFVSEEWERVYFQWMENIRDWCVSRQLWWGHQIPAWMCAACDHITVAMDAPTACEACGSDALSQDPDVLDTWFSSALWPFSTLGWPDQTAALKTFYPTTVMETGFDILFFWVARMMMMGLRFMGDVPFRTVYLHGMVRDEKGQKMSKTKGNVIDPLELTEQFGADALRFTLATMAAQARDLSLSTKRVEGYRHFANKIWNAARFVLMNVPEGHVPAPLDLDQRHALSLADKWVLGRLDRAVVAVTEALEGWRLDEASMAIYHFFWHDFCDWSLELSKSGLRAEPAAAERTRGVLLHVLEQALRLLHPFMPFITEEIWTQLPMARTEPSLVVAAWPTHDPRRVDADAASRQDQVISVIAAVRTIRGENRIAPRQSLGLVVAAPDEATAALLREAASQLEDLAAIGTLTVAVGAARPPRSAVAVAGALTLYVPLEGVVDLDEEVTRLERALTKLDEEVARLDKKLSNERFVANAPVEVVALDRERLAEAQHQIATYRETIAHLRG
jgi:valyl-tRNA synthetase